MVERKEGVEVIISASVPACPYCVAGVRKMFYNKDIFYKCLDCKALFKIVEFGQAENEVVCQEVNTIYGTENA
jgi:DNA-directed RNA polymerase subunit RPC12/RpoP